MEREQGGKYRVKNTGKEVEEEDEKAGKGKEKRKWRME